MEDNKMRNEQDLAEFELKLRMAMQRRMAPAGLKQRVLSRSRAQSRARAEHGRGWMLQRIAASALLAAVCGGIAVYHQVEERRKGEAAREQVLTAMRITHKTLDRVYGRLSEDSR